MRPTMNDITEFWNSTLTDKSWKILLELKGFKFVLIGGWAAYLWTNIHKSKDVDIVIKDFDDLSYLKKKYELKKNDSLKKYEIKFEEIDVDIYTPFFSELAIPAEEIIKYTTTIQNIEVVKAEVLLILKQGAEKDREKSVKGEKDRIDIMNLMLNADINFDQYFILLKKFKLENYYERLKNIIFNFKDIKYIGLNQRQFKLKKMQILKKLKEIR